MSVIFSYFLWVRPLGKQGIDRCKRYVYPSARGTMRSIFSSFFLSLNPMFQLGQALFLFRALSICSGAPVLFLKTHTSNKNLPFQEVIELKSHFKILRIKHLSKQGHHLDNSPMFLLIFKVNLLYRPTTSLIGRVF